MTLANLCDCLEIRSFERREAVPYYAVPGDFLAELEREELLEDLEEFVSHYQPRR